MKALLNMPIGLPLALALAAAAAATTAPTAAAAQSGAATPVVQVATGRGRLVTLARPMTDLFISNPEVADVQVRSPTSLYVFGKKAGETTIAATGKGGTTVYSSTVRVANNIDSVQQMLTLAMPESRIVATSLNGMMLLTGTVATPDDAAEAEKLVSAYVGGTVLNRLKTAVPLQVNLQVRFAEVNRTFVKNIGNNLITNDNTGGFKFGIASGNRSPGSITKNPDGTTNYSFTQGGQRTTLGFAGKLLGLDILSALDLGERTGQVTSLANPNLTALSGETGTFLAGGEIPIPVSQGLGATSVEYKQYGVSITYTPVVLSDGRISLRVKPEVSQLDYANSVNIGGSQVPSITTRRTETTIELGSGQSFMIAGLLQNIHGNSFEKTPGVGDVPVLGALFRSNAFQRNETELVIVITPYLVKPVNANDIRLPTDGYKAPSDAERVLLGHLTEGSGEGRPIPTVAPPVGAVPTIGAVAPAAPGRPVALPAPVRADDRRSSSKKAKPAKPGFSE